MNITLSKKVSYNRLKADALVVPLFKGEKESSYALPASVKKIVTAVIASKEFQGGAMETQILHTGGSGVPRVCLLGFGEKKECTLDGVQHAYGAAVMQLKKAKAKSIAFVVREDVVREKSVADVVGAIALGMRVANYHTHQYKSKKKELHSIAKCTLLITSALDHTIKRALTRAETIADGLDFVRYIANSPANYATPQYFAESAKEIAKKTPGLTVTVFDKKQIEKEKMGGLLAVAQGSQHEPRFVILEYRGLRPRTKANALVRGRQGSGNNACPIVLVGKGITFDTGGISLKPWNKMEEMKFDMCGGAAVIAVIAIAARLRLPVHVVGLVPVAENMPSHTAYKPGDVITISDGTTVEILSTDAEGRMVLADGLSYAKKYKPAVVVDVATLTGAIVAALSDYATGLFSDDDALAGTLERLGKETGDRVWRMPLPKEWGDHLKSPVADLRQVPSARLADATMAALFLKNFVDAKTPWVHLDNAGTAWKMEGYPYAEPGATGAPVQLLVRWLEELGKI